MCVSLWVFPIFQIKKWGKFPIEEGFENKQYVCSIFRDLRIAADSVPHNIILDTLKYYDFSYQSVLLMKSYLFERKQSVALENSNFSISILCHGIPQGSVLGPILLVTYINERLAVPTYGLFYLWMMPTFYINIHMNALSVCDMAEFYSCIAMTD